MFRVFGVRVEVVRGESFCSVRLGRLAFAFFKIVVELLDQVKDRRRIAVVCGNRIAFRALLIAITAHNTPFPAQSIVLRICGKA